MAPPPPPPARPPPPPPVAAFSRRATRRATGCRCGRFFVVADERFGVMHGTIYGFRIMPRFPLLDGLRVDEQSAEIWLI